MIRLQQTGMSQWVSAPRYGQQHVGVCPGGPADQFSMRSGNRMLKQDPYTPALEFSLLPPVIECTQTLTGILTGAVRDIQREKGSEKETLEAARVFVLNPGDLLRFGRIHHGLHTYLCMRPELAESLVGLRRLPFSRIATWARIDGRIRVLPGPEYDCLSEPDVFFQQTWTVSHTSGRDGIRLEGCSLRHKSSSMISVPLSDGSIQLTPGGPIVLLRHRPTVGGYPRIFNVIQADLDLLGQCGPGTQIQFILSHANEALQALRESHNSDSPHI